MNRYFKRKKDHYLFKDLFLPLISFLLIVALFGFGIRNLSGTTQEEQLHSAEQAVRRAAVQCYAIEGRYPADVAYLKENYGLAVDETKYVIHYQRIGSNLLPEIAVFSADGMGTDGE
ncbi:MAG: hypothetical protein PHE47_05005 [Oscillospiraceae bacterium]|nr:hypothetical protein [Oscillospiraceae bacterium]